MTGTRSGPRKAQPAKGRRPRQARGPAGARTASAGPRPRSGTARPPRPRRNAGLRRRGWRDRLSRHGSKRSGASNQSFRRGWPSRTSGRRGFRGSGARPPRCRRARPRAGHADGADPTGVFGKRLRPSRGGPCAWRKRTSGWLSTAQAAPAMASRGSFCPPEMMSLVLAEIPVAPEACAVHDGNG